MSDSTYLFFALMAVVNIGLGLCVARLWFHDGVFNSDEPCDACNGDGYLQGDGERCPDCDGSGIK